MFDRVATKARSPREEVPEEDLAEDVKFKSYAPLAGTQAQIERFMKEDYAPAVILTKVIQDPSAKDLDKRARLVAKLGPAKNLAKHKAEEVAYSKQVEKANLTRDFAGMSVSPSPKRRRTQGPVPTPHLGSGVPLVFPLPLQQPIASSSRVQMHHDIEMMMEEEVPVESPSPLSDPSVDEPLPSAPHTPLFLAEEDPMDESPSVEVPQDKGKGKEKEPEAEAEAEAEAEDDEDFSLLADADQPIEEYLRSIEMA